MMRRYATSNITIKRRAREPKVAFTVPHAYAARIEIFSLKNAWRCTSTGIRLHDVVFSEAQGKVHIYLYHSHFTRRE